MNIKNIISKENGKTIVFYKYGASWIAYEQSAYCLWQTGEYVPEIRHMKYLRKHVVSINFRSVLLPEIINKLSTFGLIEVKKDRVQIILNKNVNERHFINWKESIYYRNLKENVLSFSLETKTSVEAYQFLRKVQQNLNNHL
ncbi:hypothetical protein J2795_002098 [Chryseobacterium bernardetii]|jgi:hypothetical protein|uniref:Uncharacterized protein n=1 Tax=Chryseobacterium bernardetii TaxID=1241978 RepID=A0ACC6IUQ7_9FLAO|nr:MULTISPECIES: hypothetical protein [Chryseobacterium]MBP1164654.1 hypothetical protein [Chryseobacterium sp. PvR013]MDR6370856.1 hypothetical protein [Chryseobacterium vietnamense]MDR6441398.1 hypothetical protein [Chryseobacterium bernardetii]MDR6461539.1 hypothetical protein [Chryseobacterium sediminis]